MTIVPAAAPVKGMAGKPAELDAVCSVPGCGEYARDGHHMYPRSHLRGEPYDWVLLPDGSVWSNRVGLCGPHHRDVTGEPYRGHAAKIEYRAGKWYWVVLKDTPVHATWVGPLEPQPFRADDDNPPEPEPHGDGKDPNHRILASGETCPSCGYTKPATRTPGPRRAAVSWGVTVPRDTELGAEILDAWIEDYAVLLGFDTKLGKGLLRYHVLTVILAWVAQHQGQLIQDLKEAGGV